MKLKYILALAVPGVIVLAGVAVAVAKPDLIRNHIVRPLLAFAGEKKAEDDGGLYCKEHGVPEKFCTLCHEELKKTLQLCDEHGGLPEDICTLCHPEVERKYKLEMCPKGHGLPREFCDKCGKAPSASAALPDDGWCATHNQPEAGCVECLKEAAAEKETKGGAEAKASAAAKAKVCRQPLPIVRLASAKLAGRIGIQTAAVTEEVHAHRLVANAETAYDANRYAEVSPRVTGFLREIRVDLGKVVRRGEVLAVVDSSEVSAGKTQLLTSHAAVNLAQVTADRVQALTRSGAVPGKAELEVMTALNQAKASAMDAEQKLRNLGFDDEALNQFLKAKDTKNLLDVNAPIDGSIVIRHAVLGEAVDAASRLFVVADTSRMWLWIDVYEGDITKISPGQPVSFTINGSDPKGGDLSFLGKVNWVGSEVNDKTRTTRVRAELHNPDGRLRANQFGRAEIQIDPEHKAVVVPKMAVQRKDGTDLVFLPEDEPGRYRAQRIVTKPTDHGDVVEVTWGLKPGQRVVTRGAFLLKTEIMKGSIGAGCCE
ncbi:efflux RND transporter periplasmic adaptor subunit [Singulisphaera sp. PoT]|uniref:efflux RND transporter periplasmic adaptor subunit n=1 Tax=Singulisphaera sp. PoT TaxID=3411797 RepID=UPI003BF4A3AE